MSSEELPRGTVCRLVHLASDGDLARADLVPSHNYQGYGYIRADDGRQIYFPHSAVEGRGFMLMAENEPVAYELESGGSGEEELRARRVIPI
mgnify:CR=1 FL=1